MAHAADELKRVPFFNCLDQRHLRRLASKFKERRFDPGTAVVQEGKMSGIGFFIITEGEASVIVDGNEVARLGPGDHFGELALIAERERTATVTAQTRLDCLEITAWDLREFVKADPDVSWKLLQYVVNLFLDERSSPGRPV
jgi:CRP/FNR family transcriptional regulator, cyclic AMP receptor protein